LLYNTDRRGLNNPADPFANLKALILMSRGNEKYNSKMLKIRVADYAGIYKGRQVEQ
jgi:hypothetical protein